MTDLNRFHYDLQSFLHENSLKYNYISKKEYRIYNIPNFNKKYGSIDIVWYNKNNTIAIEIDSFPRIHSIIKLLNSDMDVKIWILYGKNDHISKLEEYDKNQEIICIYLGNLKTDMKRKIRKIKKNC